jgi:hypothetical protein
MPTQTEIREAAELQAKANLELAARAKTGDKLAERALQLGVRVSILLAREQLSQPSSVTAKSKTQHNP